MPYIKQDQRPKLDQLTAPLLAHLKSLPVEDQDGALNYATTRILKGLYPVRYYHLNRALGVMTAITHELYRKIIGPYEDVKIKENGDVD